MWGTIAAGVVGAIAGSRSGGGWQGAIGGALGGIFGGGGGGGGIGGWLGGLFEGIFKGMQSRREAASSHAVHQSFQQVAPRNGAAAGHDGGIRVPQLPGRPVQSQPTPTPVQARPGIGCGQPQPPSCQPQPQPAPPPPSHGCGQPEPPRVQPQPLPQPPVEERGGCCCACCQSEPSPSEGSLRVEGDKVITAGGYEIEMLSRTEWKITGPDGNSTRIWGDPHVDQSGTSSNKDWDFHRNTTFVLGDGTEVHVKTVEAKKGWTITGELTIISGNDRVVVSEIDQGKGKIGGVTQDGLQYTNSFGDYDVVVQGPQTNQWTFEGRQIIGSKDQGREFILGDCLEPGYNHQAGNNGHGWNGGLAWPLWMTSTASTHQNGHDHDASHGRI